MKQLLIISIVMLMVLASCSTSQKTVGVQRVAADAQTDLSGRWNDQDARMVAESMVRDVMSRRWINDWAEENEGKPTLIVGTIRNLSDEHIETGTFVKDIERELINAGRIKFVASSKERTEVRRERDDQQISATEDTAKRLAAETGADFMLKGDIKTITDAAEGVMAKYYQVDMELINIESNEKVWVGSQKIKKIIERKKTKW